MATECSMKLPLITFALFAYNQEKYIREAVAGALAQTYEPLEIILSDDCSADRTYQIMEEMAGLYSGPHEIVLNRNEKNLGLIGHINKVNNISRGVLIVAAAGDDISYANRVSCIFSKYDRNSRKDMLIHSSAFAVDEGGTLTGVLAPPIVTRQMNLEKMAVSDKLYIGATGAWSRQIFGQFGPILFTNAYEDLVYGFRAAIENSISYVDEPLLSYRCGVGISNKAQKESATIAEKIRKRKKSLAVMGDVYRQRLKDIDRSQVLQDDIKDRLRRILVKKINRNEASSNLYNNKSAYVASLFKGNLVNCLKAVKSEIKHIAR